MDLAILKTLMETHPTWPAPDDQTLLAWVNEETVAANKGTLSASLVFATIADNMADYTTLSADDKQMVMDILKIHAADGIPTAVGSPARNLLVSIFGGGSATITALAAALSYNISRAANAGLTGVKEAHVQHARTL